MGFSKGGVSLTSGSLSKSTLKYLLMSATIFAAVAIWAPVVANAQSGDPAASSGEPPPPPPPPDDDATAADADEPPPPPPDDSDPDAPPIDAEPVEIVPLEPGEAVVTRFSHVIEQEDEAGKPVTVIDLSGTSASIIDVRRPGDPPSGQHWMDEPQRMPVSAGEVGQVFGVALDDAETPDIFLSATSAFGLHRVQIGANQSDWMPGTWGPDAGPGTIYKIGAENGFVAEKFTDVTLDGRPNSGAALGNIAYDRQHKQLFASDLETGMIHRIDAASGKDLGHYDHGTQGRANFLDAWSNSPQSLPPIAFNPATSAKTDSCSGDFSRTPECWNIADFRRRIWGIGVRRGEAGATRLYYSVWGSDALGNSEWVKAGDDRRNSVWSVGIGANGDFDPSNVRREFFLPAFWPSTPAMGDKAGNSNPGSDITFPECGPSNVMIVAERGGVRNLGLDKPEPFARPHESRVLRYELGTDGAWRPKGRYDVGFYDRRAKEGEPLVFANSSGGAAFGYGFDGGGSIDVSMPDKSLWMTGDALCSPNGPCTSPVTGEHEDPSEVHGLQGSPADGFSPVEPDPAAAVAPAAAAPVDFGVLDQSYMIDTDINTDQSGAPDQASLTRNDATKIGDIAIYELCEAAPILPIVDPPDEDEPPPAEPPYFPVHTLDLSHDKWASSGHSVDRSWHQREASWHSVDRSWHWRSRSWHSRNQTWHWREGSWHSKARSWHWKRRSWHNKSRTWHWREGSWHEKRESWHKKGYSTHSRAYSWHNKGKSWHSRERSYHDKGRTWGNDHVKGKTWHRKGATWGGQHVKGRTWHNKGQTWGEQHHKGRTYHVKGRTWGGDQNHVKGRTYHQKGKTWDNDQKHQKGRTYHQKGKTWDNDQNHVKGRTYHQKGKTWDNDQKHQKGRTYHQKGKTWDNDQKHVKGRTNHQKGKTWDNDQKHVKGRTNHQKGKTWDSDQKHVKGRTNHQKGKTWGEPDHSKKKSQQQSGGKDQGGGQPVHTKQKSRQKSGGDQPVHTKKKSQQQTGGSDQGGGPPVHTKQKSRQKSGGDQPVHTKQKSQQQTGGNKTGGQPVHTKQKSRQKTGGDTGGAQPVHTKVKSKQQSGQSGGGQQGQSQNQGGGEPQKIHRKKKSLEEQAVQ